MQTLFCSSYFFHTLLIFPSYRKTKNLLFFSFFSQNYYICTSSKSRAKQCSETRTATKSLPVTELPTLYVLSIKLLKEIYRFSGKEGVLLTISDALVVDDKLRVLLLYTNIGNQMSTITNASIQLGEDEKISLEYLNHQVRCQWITPFTLSEKEQKCLIIYYPLSDFKNIDECNIPIKIQTNYTNYKGELYTDQFEVGQLFQNYYMPLTLTLDHDSHKLLGDISHQILLD